MKPIKQKTMLDYVEMQHEEIKRLEAAYNKRKEKLQERWPEEMYGFKWMDHWDERMVEAEMSKAYLLRNQLEYFIREQRYQDQIKAENEEMNRILDGERR